MKSDVASMISYAVMAIGTRLYAQILYSYCIQLTASVNVNECNDDELKLPPMIHVRLPHKSHMLGK